MTDLQIILYTSRIPAQTNSIYSTKPLTFAKTHALRKPFPTIEWIVVRIHPVSLPQFSSWKRSSTPLELAASRLYSMRDKRIRDTRSWRGRGCVLRAERENMSDCHSP